MRTPETTAPHHFTVPTAVGGPGQPIPALLRWAPIAGFVVLMVALARHAGLGISDPDTLWHILAGEKLSRTWSFAGPDPLADFTVHPFVMHQWLPDLGMAMADRVGGLPAVAWLAQVGRIGVCVALFLLCRHWAGPLAACLGAGLAVLGAADSLSPRPQLVGFILLAVVVGAWLRTAEDARPRWWIVPLSWVWASSHGTWVIGLMVAGAVIVGMLLDRACTPRQALRLAAIPAMSLVAAALTPVGPRLFESFSTIRAVSPFIQEWRTPTLDSLSVVATLALAVLAALIWVVRRQRVPWAHLFLFALGAGWGAMHMRTVAVAAIILAPLAAGALDTALGRPRTRLRDKEAVVIGLGAVTSLGLSAALAAAGPQTPVGVPDGLDPVLTSLPAGTVVYNADVLGGWLMWAHPDLRHTSDTRAELYGADRAREYLATMAAKPGWEEGFGRFDPGAALVPESTGLARALRSNGWVVTGSDGGYILLESADL